MILFVSILLFLHEAHFSSIMNANVYLINMKNRHDKLAASKFQLDLLGLNFKRVDAINGNSLRSVNDYSSEKGVGEVVGIKDLKLTFGDLKVSYKSGSHVGCWLSHLKAFQQILEEPDDKMSLIFEDDFIADGNAISLITDNLKSLPDDWDLFYAGHCDSRDRCERYFGYDVCKAKSEDKVVCVHAYIVKNKSVAKKLFDAGNVKEPVNADYFFQLAKINRFMTFPSIFSQRKYISADIGSGGGIFMPLRNNSIEKMLIDKRF